MTTHEHFLDGCRPRPLASYLKALGLLRLVGEQSDSSALGGWRGDRFTLCTALDRPSLERFLLTQYRPTPIVAPWNGGSGFHPKDNKKAIDLISLSKTPRLESYRTTITQSRCVLSELQINEKATGKEKAELLEACRGALPDSALDWLDAAFLLTNDGPKYPPLLGTGGNDGRLDFTNNFMQRVLDVFDPEHGKATPGSATLLRSSLFDGHTAALVRAAIGQFMPANAGGANSERGFEGPALINPWDFVLMLEGAVVFAAAAVRRMEQDTSGALSYPFTVRPVGTGYASSSDSDETSTRAETWMPIWTRLSSASEIRALLAEGRARVGRRSARSGLDFARAIAGLGVDRGITAFQRFGFQVRNGLSYLAVPLNRLPVQPQPQAGLLHELDDWLDSFRRRASASNSTAPASATRALRQLESAILELCQRADALRVQQVLIGLGRCERVMASRRRWTQDSHLRPVPALSPEWLRASDDGSAELRLASSLASVWGAYTGAGGRPMAIPIRRQFEPVVTWKAEGRLQVQWDFDAGRDVVWQPSHLETALNLVLQRRLLRGLQNGAPAYPDRGWSAGLGDIVEFIEGRVDEALLQDLIWGCILVDWTRVSVDQLPQRSRLRSPMPGAFYSILKLCFAGGCSGRPKGDTSETEDSAQIPIVPQIHRLAAAGRGGASMEQAVRRLRASGRPPAVRPFQVGGDLARRSAAALLFPIADQDRRLLAKLVLRPEGLDDDSAIAPTETREGATG